MSDLLFSLGLDVTDLKTSAKVAKDQADDIKKSFKSFGDIFAAGGITTAVVGFFRGVIDYAQEATGALDENTLAVRRFGEALTEGKKTSLSWGTQFLGFLNRIGESAGETARGIFEGFKAALSTTGGFKERLAAYDEAGQRVVKTNADALRVEKETIAAEAKRKTQKEELKRLDEESARLAKQRHDIGLRGLTTQEQYNQLFNEVLDLENKLAISNATGVEKRKIQNEIAAAQNALLAKSIELEKEKADAVKKAAEDKKKAAEKQAQEEEKFLDEQAKKNEEIAELELKGISNLTDAEKVRLEVLKGVRTQREVEKEVANLLVRGVENLTDAERARLAVLIEQTDEVEKQKRAAAAAAAEAAARAKFAGSIRTEGRADGDLSERELERKRQTLLDDIFIRRRKERENGAWAGQNFHDPLLGMQQAALARVEEQLRLREETRRNARIFGEDAAFAMSGLTEAEFSEILGQATKSDKIINQLERLNRNAIATNEALKTLNRRSGD